jgi:DsbC/DsbD-like thiol-disulfide interchange protein
MITTGRLSGLALVASLALLGAAGEGRAQGKKSDAVVKVKAEAAKANADGTTNVEVTLTVDRGWHIYANPVGLEDQAEAATTVSVGGTAKAESVDYPPGKLVKDKVLGDYKVYEGKVTITAKVRRPAGGGAIDVAIKFQACSDSRCLVPATVNVSVP